MRRFLLRAALVALLLPTALSAQEPGDILQLRFLDVGQGDAVLIEVPTGQRVLIDAGRDDAVLEHLLRLQVDTIELFIASHNHADHIGGAVAVLEEIPVRFFMDNGVAHTTRTYRRLLETLRDLDIPLLEPERRTIEVGDAALDILSPPGEPTWGHNDNSVGVVVRFGEFRALLAGDAERRLWRHWLETAADDFGPVGVLKASHHGSRNGDVGAVLERVCPRLVVVSAGRNNPYGHPHVEALERYEAVGAAVLLTADEGTVSISATRDGSFQVVTEHGFADSGVQAASCVE